MKNLKRVLFVFVFTIFSSVFAYAEVTIAFCKLGEGCKFYQTQYTYRQVDGMLGYQGVYSRDKGIMVFFRNKQAEDVHYPDQKRNAKELHKYFGGKGDPSVAKGGVLPFENSIQPLDGMWTVVTQQPVTKNCPAQLEERLTALIDVKSGNKTFSKPFTAADLLPAKTVWINNSLNSYRAFLMPETKPIFRNIYDFEVQSPSLIIGTLRVAMEIPNQKTCEITTNFTYQRSDKN
jgi:hypothetical protein